MLRERREAATCLDDCLHLICEKYGYERFLLAPTQDELKQSANEGPIVIVNATNIRYDAILIFASRIHAIALPEMNTPHTPSFFYQRLGPYRAIDDKEFKKNERDIENDMKRNHYTTAQVEHMSWLWSSCVQPILKELKDSQALDSHKLFRVCRIISISCRRSV